MTDVVSPTFQPPTDPTEQTLKIGELWRLTFRTFRQAPWRLILLALLPTLFNIATLVVRAPFKGSRDMVAVGIFSLVVVISLIGQLAVQLIVQSAMIFAATRLMTGGNFTIGQALGAGVRRFWPVLGLILLLLPIIGLGYLLFIFPGIILGLVFAVAYQACLFERLGPIEAMQRSAVLTRGNRARIFLAYLAFLAIPLLLFALVTAGFAIWISSHPNDALVFMAIGLTVILMIPVSLVLSALLSVLFAAIFVELRRLKDGGIGKEAIASVFD